MKAILAAVALGIACSALHAQVLEREQGKDKAAIKPERARPAEGRDHDRRHRNERPRRDERPVERQTSEGPVKLDHARPARAPRSAPSPAEQQQRHLYEERQSRQR